MELFNFVENDIVESINGKNKWKNLISSHILNSVGKVSDNSFMESVLLNYWMR